MLNKLEFDIMKREEVIHTVEVDFLNNKVTLDTFANNILDIQFLKQPTVVDILKWLEWRCVPRDRVNIKEVLNELNLITYNPVEIVKKTHGLMWHDYIWVKFKGEDIKYEDIKIRDRYNGLGYNDK